MDTTGTLQAGMMATPTPVVTEDKPTPKPRKKKEKKDKATIQSSLASAVASAKPTSGLAAETPSKGEGVISGTSATGVTPTSKPGPKRKRGPKPAEDRESSAPPRKRRKDAIDKPAKIKAPKVQAPIDLDKQCGVMSAANIPCTRAITCKSHSVLAKRQVEGRSRSYDVLVTIYQSRAMERKAIFPVHADSLSKTNKGSSSSKSALGRTGTGVDDLPDLPPEEEAKAILQAVDLYLKNPHPETNGPVATRYFPSSKDRAEFMFGQILEDVLPATVDTE